MLPHAELDDPETYQIIGAGMAVHGELGRGFLECVYREALHIELTRRGIGFQTEVRIPVMYKGTPLPISFRADLVCGSGIIVELKAIPAISRADLAQLGNYLKAGRCTRGLLLNFGSASLEYRRMTLRAQS